MARVNPPPQLTIPKEIKGELRRFLSRLIFIVFQLWKRSGGAEDKVESANRNNFNVAQFDELSQRVGSGDTLTCDDTGFTCDATVFTCDQTEA